MGKRPESCAEIDGSCCYTQGDVALNERGWIEREFAAASISFANTPGSSSQTAPFGTRPRTTFLFRQALTAFQKLTSRCMATASDGHQIACSVIVPILDNIAALAAVVSDPTQGAIAFGVQESRNCYELVAIRRANRQWWRYSFYVRRGLIAS